MAAAVPEVHLVPLAPGHILALIDAEQAFAEQFGRPAAEGLRAFYTSGEVAPEWIAQLRNATAADPWVHGFAIVHEPSGQVIGMVGFKGAPDAEGMVEIGYGIVPAFERRGHATAAAAAVVAFAYEDPRVRTVRAHTLPERNASTRVLEKLGFTHAGEVIDPQDGRVWRWEQRAR